jgi:hypothetical protein
MTCQLEASVVQLEVSTDPPTMRWPCPLMIPPERDAMPRLGERCVHHFTLDDAGDGSSL